MPIKDPPLAHGVVSHAIGDDGAFPNNAAVPLILARQRLTANTGATAFEALFRRNGWPPAWRSGIFDFNHYHSSAHEVLGCFAGSAILSFGGATDLRLTIGVGDAVIIPAGVAHRCIRDDGFACVGAYPVGQAWDTCYGKTNERPAADARIAALGKWPSDPFR